MTRAQWVVFSVALLTFSGWCCWGLLGLAPFGFYPGPYGDVLDHVAVAERHVLNVATAINFDYRGFDTLIEEYIFFAAVAGCGLVFDDQLSEDKEITDEPDMKGAEPHRSDAVAWLAYVIVPLGIMLACYMAVHGQLSPGGGFQSGAIAGSALSLVYLGLRYVAYRQFAPRKAADIVDAIGAGGYAITGITTLVLGGYFLKNVLPLGTTGNVDSSGTIAVINLLVFIEVSAGTVGALHLFFDRTRKVKRHS